MTDQQELKGVFRTPFGECVPESGEVYHPATSATGDPIPHEQVKEWWDRINEIRREINAAGLCFEAVIYNPPIAPFCGGQREPATLYGKPLAVTATQQMIDKLAEVARDPATIVRHEVRVMSRTRTVVEVEVVTP